METLNHADPFAVDELLGELRSAVPLYDAPAARRSWLKWLLAAALVAGVGGLAWAAWAVFGVGVQAPTSGPLTTYKVKRGDLLVTVTEEGSLESAENVEIKCEVAGGTSIVWIIDDGKEVKKGTELLRLDGSKLKEDVGQQKIAYEKALASKIQAAKDFDAAKIAVEEYVQGTFKKDLSEAESKVTVARGSLHSAENTLQHGERMFRKGYISPLQLEAQKTAVEHAKLDLGTAEIARDVLRKFTRPKMIQELESKRDAAAAKRDSEKASLDLEEAKLKRLTTQLEKCTGPRPQGGTGDLCQRTDVLGQPRQRDQGRHEALRGANDPPPARLEPDAGQGRRCMKRKSISSAPACGPGSASRITSSRGRWSRSPIGRRRAGSWPRPRNTRSRSTSTEPRRICGRE